jgi:ribosomal 30S subunit maturation factor RimM
MNMSQLPRIIDNNRKGLLETIQEVATNYDSLSIATGYWDLKGMQKVFNQIKKYKKIRLLIGREPLIPRHRQYQPEADYPDKDFFYDLEQMQPSPELKELVGSIKTMIEQGNLEVACLS